MRISKRRLLVALSSLAITLYSPPGFTQQASETHPKHSPNGIAVGKPKVFDNRTLTIMLESLSQALQSIQTQFVDQKSIASALGSFQGFRSSETSSGLSIGTLPLPEAKQELVTTTGNTTSSGQALPDTSKTTTTTTRSALTPQAPSLEAAPTFSGYTPTYGPSASDLLNDQVNLSYQIFNLRMILERSLSDRLVDNLPRMQAVLGFNVTIDPPQTAGDAVAVVEITLHAAAEPSLVALMPQEKTYNSATLSTKSNAFGGSAIVNMVQVGYSERRKGQTFYLYRDNDTIAYERMNPDDPHEIIFGWMFRPVLGRRAVSPGFRQLFAILALPASDNCGAADVAAHRCPEQHLSAHVRTFWKKYDAGTLTSFESRDARRAERFRYAMTLGLSRPEVFEDRYKNERDYPDIPVKTTAAYEDGLGPTIQSVSWTPVGPKNALVSAIGQNFFTGTQVALGDKTYAGGGDGLVLKSTDAFDLLTTLDALVTGPGAVIGRYGPAVVFSPKAEAVAPTDASLAIHHTEIGPSISGTHALAVYLMRGPLVLGKYSSLTLAALPHGAGGELISPLIAVNGNTMALPYSIDQIEDSTGRYCDGACIVVRGSIPDSSLTGGNAVVRVSWPFQPRSWTAVSHYADPNAAYQVVRVSEKSVVLMANNAAGFINRADAPGTPLAPGQCWTLFAGEAPVVLRTATCPAGDPRSAGAGPNAISVTMTSALPDKVVLLNPLGRGIPLDVPKLVADSASPKVINLNQYDSIWIEIPLTDAAKVGSCEANQQSIKCMPKPGKDGEASKSVRVQVTRDLTSKPGSVDVTVLDKSGGSLGTARLLIAPCKDCNSEGGK
jgi:hypothetical protein